MTTLPPSSSAEPSLAAGTAVGSPRLSVIVPTRHRPDSLAKCLRQLAPGAQMLAADRYEVIVTDDGAPGTTVETLIRDRFPWVRWTAGPRRGPAANRNHGASLAEGDWLVFTDDDCVPDAGWLGAIAEALATNRSERVIEGCTTCEPDWKGPLWAAPTNEHGGFLWSCNFAIERAFFQELGGFDAGFPFAHLEDVDLRMRIQARGVAMHFVPAALVVHPQRPIASVRHNVVAHESCFYLSAKHGIPLRESGISWRHLVRVKARLLLGSPSFAQAWRYGLRSAAEAVLVVLLCPWWAWKYFLFPRGSAAQGGT